jgi:NhaC family Na+:H+ antiporter
MIFQGYSFLDNINFVMNGFSIDSGVDAVNTLVNRGGFSSMLYLVGILLACGLLSGLLSEMKVLHVLVNGISKKVKTPAGLLAGVWSSSLLLVLTTGGQYPAIAIPAVAFKDACDEMDINRAVLSRTLEDVGTMVAAIVPWSAWVIGYGVLLGTTVREFIPFTFLCILSPIVALINIFLGFGLFRKSDEIRYRPLWRRGKVEKNVSGPQ